MIYVYLQLIKQINKWITMSTEYRINENKTPPLSDHKRVWLAKLTRQQKQ